MNLQSKFMAVMGLFGLTVAVGLGVALAFASLLTREVVEPFRATTALHGHLNRLEQTTGKQADLLPLSDHDETLRRRKLGEPGSADSAREEYGRLRRQFDEELEALVATPLFSERIGVATERGIRERVARARALASDWFSHSEPGVGVRAGEAHNALHKLIESAEAKVLRDASASLAFGDLLQRTFQLVVVAAVLAALLMAVLGTLLVRRWISRPIERLRVAAQRIAAGDYAHRVPVETVDELGRLGLDVNEMAALIAKTQEEEVERARLASTGALMGRLAHSIRNPLSGIRALAELTMRRVPDHESVREDQTLIVDTVDRFNAWLKELLDATTPVEVRPHRSEVKMWLERVVRSHEALARMRSVTLELGTAGSPETARFDARHLEHALVAVVANAIQASPPDSVVSVESRAVEDGAVWELRVVDRGMGIPEELRSDVFRPYFTTKPDGTGIGLAVAQQVVRLHQGTIAFESARSGPNSGCTFVIRIPIVDSGSHTVDIDQAMG